MSRMDDVLTGLRIFEVHGGKDVNAEHDQIWSGPKDGTMLTADEMARLDAAGWFRDPDTCNGDDCNARYKNGEIVGEHSPDCTSWTIYI